MEKVREEPTEEGSREVNLVPGAETATKEAMEEPMETDEPACDAMKSDDEAPQLTKIDETRELGPEELVEEAEPPLLTPASKLNLTRDSNEFIEPEDWDLELEEDDGQEPAAKVKKTLSDVLNENNNVAEAVMGSREDRSLGMMTRRFLDYLHASEEKKCDLNVAATALGCPQKRRLYDITNVLEGIGLVTKTSKGIIQWSGQIYALTPNLEEKMEVLEKQIDEQKPKEQELDEMIAVAKQELRDLVYKESNLKYMYSTADDVAQIFPKSNPLLVQERSAMRIRTAPPSFRIHNHRLLRKFPLNMVVPSGHINANVLVENEPERQTLLGVEEPEVCEEGPSRSLMPLPFPKSTTNHSDSEESIEVAPETPHHFQYINHLSGEIPVWAAERFTPTLAPSRVVLEPMRIKVVPPNFADYMQQHPL